MIRNPMGTVAALLCALMVGAAALAAQSGTVEAQSHSGTRSFQSAWAAPGSQVRVNITVRNYGAFGQVVEQLPPGFSYGGNSLGVIHEEVEGQTLRINLLGETGFSYTVSAPMTEGQYTFSGVIKNIDREERTIEGRSTLRVGPPPIPRPRAAPTPTPEPTQTPTATPEPEPTATSTPAPTASLTPEPTEAPTPTAMHTPKPTPTPAPTATAAPAPTPTPVPQPTAQPAAPAEEPDGGPSTSRSGNIVFRSFGTASPYASVLTITANSKEPMRLAALASLLVVALCLGCSSLAGSQNQSIPTPKLAVNPTLTVEETEYRKAQLARGVNIVNPVVWQYLGQGEAEGHLCINSDPPIQSGFWELAYTSAYQAVENFCTDSYRDTAVRWEDGLALTELTWNQSRCSPLPLVICAKEGESAVSPFDCGFRLSPNRFWTPIAASFTTAPKDTWTKKPARSLISDPGEM